MYAESFGSGSQWCYSLGFDTPIFTLRLPNSGYKTYGNFHKVISDWKNYANEWKAYATKEISEE